jgi:ABC-type Co2+ transport system permease subunit
MRPRVVIYQPARTEAMRLGMVQGKTACTKIGRRSLTAPHHVISLAFGQLFLAGWQIVDLRANGFLMLCHKVAPFCEARLAKAYRELQALAIVAIFILIYPP